MAENIFLANLRDTVGYKRLYKPDSDWLEMLPLDSTGLNMYEYFLLDINEMKRNDLWLNVKGNYMLFVVKILLNLY